ALSLRLEVSHEPVCYSVWRSIYAGARLTIPLTASPTKMRTGSKTQTKPKPNPTQTKPKPNPNQTQTKPKPNPNPNPE
ncbi:hypothetical protein, partial [Paraburkholderia caribensis]|uniref:hypothetical protein n=1 Tax=Paraburkholderia caribensis TaxID=75105 RepID=UPI001ABA30F1